MRENEEIMRASSTALLLVAATGCFTTVIRPPGAVVGGPTYNDRQWFTLAGLVPLSSPAGYECGSAGLSYAESSQSFVDVLLNIGLAVGGGLIGAAVCPLPDKPTADESRQYSICTAGFAGLVPFLVSSRTVTYGCNGGGPGLNPVTGP
jgi:hypothetical protein